MTELIIVHRADTPGEHTTSGISCWCCPIVIQVELGKLIVLEEAVERSVN